MTFFAGPDPAATTFVIQSGRPTSLGSVAFSLIAVDAIGLYVTSKHDARVCFTLGQLDLDDQMKVRILFFCDQKELLVGG